MIACTHLYHINICIYIYTCVSMYIYTYIYIIYMYILYTPILYKYIKFPIKQIAPVLHHYKAIKHRKHILITHLLLLKHVLLNTSLLLNNWSIISTALYDCIYQYWNMFCPIQLYYIWYIYTLLYSHLKHIYTYNRWF